MTKMDYEEEENILDYSLDNISIRTDILQRMVCNFVSCPVTCQSILFQGHYALVPAMQSNRFPAHRIRVSSKKRMERIKMFQ